MNELVKEIEEAERELYEAAQRIKHDYNSILAEDIFNAAKTLQRVREALRWIPVSERQPEDYQDYEVTRWRLDPNTGEIVYYTDWSGYHPGEKRFGKPNTVAWRAKPTPYTPEEK